jgi:general secretion pathway protein J
MTVLADRRRGEGGFTMIEALVALALMGLLLSVLANLTAQWLPNWNRGFDRIQRSEMIGITLQRLADDLADALPVPASASDMGPFFSGSEQSIIFVRTALGPNAGSELDVVRLSETTDRAGLATVRSRTQFRPMQPNASASSQFRFREPVVLLRAPYRLTFAYGGDDDEEWQSSWRDPAKLPNRIKLTVQDSSNGRAISTVTSIHVQSSPQDDGDTSTPGNQNGPPQANSSNQPQPAAAQGNAR